MFTWLYNHILYQPLLNLLIGFYNVFPVHDLGIAIIIFTILIRLLLYPLSQKAIRSQKALQDLQPKMLEIQKAYKDDKEKQAKELMKIYKENKVNPLSSCLPILIQIPFLIAVYAVFRDGISADSLNKLYPFVTKPETINVVFLGLIDLAKPNILLAVLAGLGQFVQTKMFITKQQPKIKGSEDESTMAIMNKQMTYMMPILTVIIGISLPGGLTLYWLITTILMILQQHLVMKEKRENNH